MAISCIHGCLLIVDTLTLVDSTGFEERRRAAALRYYLLKKHPLINEIAINLRRGYGRQASRAMALLRNDVNTRSSSFIKADTECQIDGYTDLQSLSTVAHTVNNSE